MRDSHPSLFQIADTNHSESICCLDKDEVCESYFKSILSFVFEIFLSSNLLRRK